MNTFVIRLISIVRFLFIARLLLVVVALGQGYILSISVADPDPFGLKCPQKSNKIIRLSYIFIYLINNITVISWRNIFLIEKNYGIFLIKGRIRSWIRIRIKMTRIRNTVSHNLHFYPHPFIQTDIFSPNYSESVPFFPRFFTSYKNMDPLPGGCLEEGGWRT